jgi:hypothetical protein
MVNVNQEDNCPAQSPKPSVSIPELFLFDKRF